MLFGYRVYFELTGMLCACSVPGSVMCEPSGMSESLTTKVGSSWEAVRGASSLRVA